MTEPASQPVNTRPGLPLATVAETLGPLTELSGTWIGTGFNLVSLPDFDPNPPSTGPLPFRIRLSSTIEILEFTPIGGAVPNRGSTGQDDIQIFGLRYLQRIADSVTNEALHIEPGFWLNVPATTVPPGSATVVRQGSIPHGTSVLALGTALTVPSGPGDRTRLRRGRCYAFDARQEPPNASSAWRRISGAVQRPGVAAGFQADLRRESEPGPRGSDLGAGHYPDGGAAISTAAPAAGPATQVGGTVNMPFDVANADATRLDAIFWIETVQQPDGSTFLQLQYTQTVILHFLEIDWPHISVATLTLQ